MAKRVGVCGFNLLVIDTENKARAEPEPNPAGTEPNPAARCHVALAQGCATPLSLAAMHQGGLTCWS